MSTQQPDSNSDLLQDFKSNSSNVCAITIPVFCEKYNISTSTFYRNIEKMPKTVYIGKHPRILLSAEHEWLDRLPMTMMNKSS